MSEAAPPDGPVDAASQATARARALEQPAFITIADAELLRAWSGDLVPGSLDGMTFAVKDNIDVAGTPTTAANPARATPAAEHAFVVRRLLEAGAMPVGKTNLDQYATGLVGTRSPYGACHSVFSDLHVSGGSSSGSALAVAAGVVDFALATDTAGSGRVPAAFNGLVGFKATKGLLSTSGVLPACRSLDCVTVLARSVATVRAVLAEAAAFDPADPFARPAPRPMFTPAPTPRRRPVVGVPVVDLDLDPAHERAWQEALQRAAELFTVVEFDVRPFLAAAQLLYAGPWVAERTAAVGEELTDEAAAAGHLDPTVRAIIQGGARLSAVAAYTGLYQLAGFARAVEATWAVADAILLPVTPGHPTLAEVAADPFGVNATLGRFTNMTNLLDLAAIAVPAGRREDGLPFGVQFLGPAFCDDLLIGIGGAWTGEAAAAPRSRAPAAQPGAPGEARVAVAVAGAHLTGQPLNADLVARGGRLVRATTTAAGYRMFEVPGPVRRPGLTRVAAGQQYPPSHGVEVEVWSLPVAEFAGFVGTILPPLAVGPLTLADGEQVLGFVCTADGADPERDITAHGGWRAYLAATDGRPAPAR